MRQAFSFERSQRLFGVFDDLVVLFHLAQFDQLDVVGQVLLDPVVRAHRIDQHLPFAHQLLCGFGIVPQVRVLDPRIELFQPVLGRIDIQPLGQQSNRFFDLIDDVLNFCAHLYSSLAGPRDSPRPGQPQGHTGRCRQRANPWGL